MRAFLRSSALLVLLAACSRKPDDPRVEFINIGFKVSLPPGMQQALDSLAPGFKYIAINSFRSDISQYAAEAGGGMQPLFATITDLDGDGALDAVVEGTSAGDVALRVIAIMNGPKPTAMEIQRFPVYDADAVGIYLSRPKGSRLGAFEVVNYPDSSTAFQYKAGRFIGTRIGN